MGDLVLMLGTHISGWPCAEVSDSMFQGGTGYRL